VKRINVENEGRAYPNGVVATPIWCEACGQPPTHFFEIGKKRFLLCWRCGEALPRSSNQPVTDKQTKQTHPPPLDNAVASLLVKSKSLADMKRKGYP
jgi:hypothetical protein